MVPERYGSASARVDDHAVGAEGWIGSGGVLAPRLAAANWLAAAQAALGIALDDPHAVLSVGKAGEVDELAAFGFPSVGPEGRRFRMWTQHVHSSFVGLVAGVHFFATRSGLC